ncbi:MarR family winged helix-turn-helix transcriptional regulator [Streptomyces roseirectus]|uniref:MarR family winged helix-turn-helix transcriptional regulator n=1 Tax=Streptomyces roseirectus TaxID=2768066 RepID=UPI001FE81334|nr:MarR family transcriptional regulator [Streptomyces roseirectus]
MGGRAGRTIREASGLGGPESEALLRLAHHPEHRTTAASLAEELSFHSGSLPRLTARMEEAGLTARHPHPDDRRAVTCWSAPSSHTSRRSPPTWPTRSPRSNT